MNQPTFFEAGYLDSGATIDPTGRYRYDLRRAWAEPRRVANFIMLNPSTADASADDPTIRRCIGFAKSWGYDALVVTNLYALRSTDPGALRRVEDPIGPDNDRSLDAEARAAALVVCAWGNHGAIGGRGRAVLRRLADLGVAPHCLRVTGLSQPSHPLYLPAGLRPSTMAIF